MASIRLTVSILLASVCAAFPQRLYNEANDRKATEALGLSQQVLSGQVWDKALTNLDELYKRRQQMVFESAEGILKAEWATWETWADVKATFGRLPKPAEPTEASFKQEMAKLKASRVKAEAELDHLRARMFQDKTAEQVRMVGLWMERIGAARPFFERIVKMEEDATIGKVNLEAAAAAKKALDGLSTLYKTFRAEIPAQSASMLFLEGEIRLLELEQAHLLRLAAIQERLQTESERVEKLRKRSQALLDQVLAKYPGANIVESFAKAKTENPDLVQVMVSALYHVAASAARADLPVRLAGHRESLELRAQAIRRDAANAAVYERVVANGVQRLAAYHKGGIRPENLASFIRALATAGLIPAILTR